MVAKPCFLSDSHLSGSIPTCGDALCGCGDALWSAGSNHHGGAASLAGLALGVEYRGNLSAEDLFVSKWKYRLQ